jgi:hypothetical protein
VETNTTRQPTDKSFIDNVMWKMTGVDMECMPAAVLSACGTSQGEGHMGERREVGGASVCTQSDGMKGRCVTVAVWMGKKDCERM